MRLPTLVRIPNHSLVVNHLSPDGGAGGIRYTSAPPTTTPSADTTRKEQSQRAILKHPGKVKQLPPLFRTDQAGPSKRLRERDTSNGEPQHKVKRVKVSSFVATHEALAAQKQQRNLNALPARRHFPEVSTPILPVPSISFDWNSLVQKPATKTRRDPGVNALRLNAARMQGIPAAGSLIVQSAAEEETSVTSSRLMSLATTAGPPSLAPLAAVATTSLAPLSSIATPSLVPSGSTAGAGTSSVPSAATMSLAPSASISNQPGAIKQRGKGAWQLSWYGCPHTAAIMSLSIAVFRQTMLQNHPFDTRNLDAISLESYQSAVASLKDSADKGES